MAYYDSGWTWNLDNDSLLPLFLDDGYGITGAFNATNKEFESCTLSNVTALTKDGDWGKIEFDSKDIKFYVYRQHYHVSWVRVIPLY